MLWQRVVTAVVLLLVLLPALFYPSPAPFCALAIVFIAACAWELARLVGYGPLAALGAAAACGGACLGAWAAGLLDGHLLWLWIAAGAWWVLGGVLLLRGGVAAWSGLPRPLRLGGGLLVLLVAWLAVAQARAIGINFLLSVLLLVWVADICAYFTGRALGGRFTRSKLAPGISPGKSWEGVWGGMAGVMLLAVCWRWADAAWQPASPSLYSRLLRGGDWLPLVAVLWLVGMSVVGDLVESLVKRAAAAKDSSGLLPGHGGVLDRLDALLPTLPLAMLLYSLGAGRS
jgi:phosphatidate cytidylyltransferase